jgi:predicted membrane channel-forming protein YqfA (hemolysin III family)
MKQNESRLHGKLKIAGYLLLAGLAVEGITLNWSHPTSFLLFIILGGVLILAGIVVYLVEVVTG